MNKVFNHYTSTFKTKNLKIFYTLLLISIFPFWAVAQCYNFNCFENKEISLDANCQRVGSSSLLLVNPTHCISGPKEVVFFTPNGDPIGNTINGEYLDMTIEYLITDIWTNNFCFGHVTIRDERGPDIVCENITLKCNEDYSPQSIGTPDAVDNCTYVTGLTFTDEVIDFGCGEQGFTGYFDPENWGTCIIGSNGDGGVDVTGAPNSISVEGADNSPISDNCPYVTQYKIEVPTEGYISFDWSSFGGSAFDHENAFFTIGDTCVQLTMNDVIDGSTVTSGSFSSWLIPAGTWISFEVTSNGDNNGLTTVFEDFQFITPAIKVINRTWVGYDAFQNQGSCTQIITLERTLLDDVHFPENRDGVVAPLLECGASTNPTFTEPNYTGYPFLDEDGNLSTTTDQSSFFGSSECLFDVFYNDILIPDCDGNYTVARTWTVFDQCTEQSKEHLQIIRVADTLPPVFDCPADFTVSTNGFDCAATITVPSFTAIDACSNTITYSSAWTYGLGQSTYTGVSIGTHTMTVSATDGCNNTSQCTVNITVEDQVEPQVICDATTVAAVTSAGESIVFAESIDDGSYDFCCANSQLLFEVKLEDVPDSEYAPTIVFDCGYVGGAADINMRVTDCYGNSNYCTVTVEIQDNEAPAVFCPSNVMVDCGTDWSDLSVFGTVAAADNCSYEIEESITTNINSCGLGMLIRSYSVSDNIGNTSTCEQVITIENLTPWNADENQINFPPNYTFVGDCTSSILPEDLPTPFDIPTYEGVMGCETPARSFEDEIFYIAEPACYNVIRTWSIMDWCGDGTIYTGIQLIEVQDNNAPVFDYLQNDISITLSGANNCTANVSLVAPIVFDCSENMEVVVSGDLGTSFGIIEDVPIGIYMVTYTATDGCGNSAVNNFTVTVEDNTVPEINCPENMTVDCSTDLTNLADFGTAIVTENCSMDTYSISEEITDVLNECGQGFVQRVWTISDENNNTSFCNQYIYVENQTPWNSTNNLIAFPADYVLSGDCNMGTSPTDLPIEYAFPVWSNAGTCEFIQLDFEDETVMIAPPNCYQINRTWTVTDICNQGQSWIDIQTIFVEDNDAPLFINAPQSFTIAPDNPTNCTVDIAISYPEMEECDPNVEVLLLGDLTAGFGTYDLMPGVYDLTYSATDGCGNSTTHSYQITVIDNIAPTAVCLNGLSLDMPVSLNMEVTAATINAASFDNCTASNQLIYSFSTNTNDQTVAIDCDNIGNTVWTIWVTDAVGNQSSCTSSIQINDENEYCSGEQSVIMPDIFGSILNWEGEEVALVDVQLQNTGLAPYQTTDLGTYEFLDRTIGDNYTVLPTKDINDLNGVTTLDVVKLNDHIDNIQLLTNPYQMIAGDADYSHDLNAADIEEIENAILFNENGFPLTTSWRFVDADYSFPAGANPIANGYPENVLINNIQTDEIANFIAVKTGDLNGTSNPLNLTGEDSEERDGEDLLLQVTDTTLVAGETYILTFTIAEIADFLAYQFTLDFDVNALVINEISSAQLPFITQRSFGTALLSEGALTTLWYNKNHGDLENNTAAFDIEFRAEMDGKLSDFISVSSRFTTALSYHNDESVASVQLEFLEEQKEVEEIIFINDKFDLFQNAPNPFFDKTKIGFHVPYTSEVVFTFYDLRGIEIYRTVQTYEAGHHQLVVTRENLHSSLDELIFYKMESGEFRDAKKLVMMRQ